AEDYANLAQAALSLYKVTFDLTYLDRAVSLVEELEAVCGDPASGGFFQSSTRAGALLVRPLNALETATPNANGTMIGVYGTLFSIIGEPGYLDKQNRLIAAFGTSLERNAFSMATYVMEVARAQAGVVLYLEGTNDAMANARAALKTLPLPVRLEIIPVPTRDLMSATHPLKDTNANEPSGISLHFCQQGRCSLPFHDTAQAPDVLKTFLSA
ncbi:MAG: hypothetical protein AAGB03_10700, partial [Pseudomonadota bacterium]